SLTVAIFFGERRSSRFQTRTSPGLIRVKPPQLTRARPPGAKRTYSTHSLCPTRLARRCPLHTSNSCTSAYWAWSPPPAASVAPSGEKSIHSTCPFCPSNFPSSFPDSTSHNLISPGGWLLRGAWQVASRLPSAEKATH